MGVVRNSVLHVTHVSNDFFFWLKEAGSLLAMSPMCRFPITIRKILVYRRSAPRCLQEQAL